ncbi:hypothetical protein MKW98_004016 [Papaver atlanticum]|uniref:AB hydrolase-1 domain-containing protein n=1 Tax=Papaver atlanticum TaxID=357466 RepID=A0AAD4T0S3_9MAGN|nr:hypothetical protein MKW98_004016 [Papaver atlanticum]
MGNFMSCSSSSSQSKQVKKKLFPKRSSSCKDNNNNNNQSSRWNRNRSSKKDDSPLNQEDAIAAAMLFQQQQLQNVGAFDRSTSLRYTNGNNSKKQQALPRSSSSRARSVSDTILQPHQLLNQELKIDELETSHFVLVHGGGYGAWCWYKTMSLLEEAGFKVDAIDLTGSGIHSCDTNTITSLAQYVKPLVLLLQNLQDGHKVILVGHDFGGACISYAMELFPHKIAKAIFIAASMLTDGQSTLDIFNQQSGSNDLMRQAQVFLYANGNDHPPTAIDLDKSLLKDLLFNQSPAKDVALASVSMRPIPFAPVLEKLSLSEKNYGAVRRFYIETTEDDAIPLSVQQNMITSNPPERVFRIKGSDHSPFFSKPQSLHKHLVEISTIPAIEKCGNSVIG